MARTRTTSRTRRNGELGPRQLLAVRAGLWAIVLGLTGLAAYMAGRTAWAGLANRPEFALAGARSVEWPAVPQWVMGERMVRALDAQAAALPPGMFVLGTRPPEDGAAVNSDEPQQALSAPHLLYERLVAFPWIEKVDRIEKRLPDRLVVHATFRRPAGVVLWRDERHLVDRHGRWLEREGVWFRLPAEWDEARTPVIVDRAMQELPQPGQRWNGPRLAVGACLNAYLRRAGLYERLHVTGIDVQWVQRGAQNTVSEGSTQPEITLLTESGARVKWGKCAAYGDVAGLAPALTEDADQTKLARLLEVLEEHPDLAGFKYVDVRYPTVVSRVTPGI